MENLSQFCEMSCNITLDFLLQGTFTVIAKNIAGKDKVSISVKVLEKPGPPEGPLKVCSLNKIANDAY